MIKEEPIQERIARTFSGCQRDRVYESKTADSLKALKITAPAAREEGIAILDVAPVSPAFGKILMQIPLPPDLVAHHIFFDRTQTKAYVAALGKAELHTFSLTEFPYRLRKIPVPGCEVGEDVIFSENNSTWYLTCMGSAAVAWGDVATDTVRGLMKLPGTYPHGLAVHTGIDRGLVTSTVRASDLGDAGEVVSVFQPSTKKVLGQIKLSNEPGFRACAGVRFRAAQGQRAARDVFPQGRCEPHVPDHGGAGASAHLRYLEPLAAETAEKPESG